MECMLRKRNAVSTFNVLADNMVIVQKLFSSVSV